MNEACKSKRVEGEGFWRGHAEAWQQSGQTITEYIAEHGLCRSTFRRWRRQLGYMSLPSVPTAPLRLARVQVSELRAAAGGNDLRCQLSLPNGIAIDWPVAGQAERLAGLLEVIRSWK